MLPDQIAISGKNDKDLYTAYIHIQNYSIHTYTKFGVYTHVQKFKNNE